MTSAIQISGLCYHYPDGNEALHGVNLIIRSGESVALMGPNGAGKTTLFYHLNGLLEGTKGTVEIFGTTIAGKKSLKQVRRRVGIVFQNPEHQLFCPTVFDDVAFGPLNFGVPSEEIEMRVHKALEAVGMSGFEKRVPHHLSFGEKKRISLATILAVEPDIILLDEPTSNLDPRARRKVINVIESLNITKVIATHDLEMALELCQRGIIMDKGSIVCDGKISDVLKDKELLESHGLEVPYSLRYAVVG